MCGAITGTANMPITTNMIMVKRLERFSIRLSYMDTNENSHKQNLNELVQSSNTPYTWAIYSNIFIMFESVLSYLNYF